MSPESPSPLPFAATGRAGTGIAGSQRLASRAWHAHWGGRVPLPVAFWLCTVLPWLLLSLVLAGLGSRLAIHGDLWLPASRALLLGWPLWWLLTLWAGVGLWRSAGRHLQQGGAPLWAWGARGLWLLLLAALVGATTLHFAPHAAGYWHLALGSKAVERLRIEPGLDGQQLRLVGTIGRGDGERVHAALQAASEVWMLELDSPGGSWAEARRVAEAVRARAAQTRVIGRCNNACVAVLAAGRARHVRPGATIGLHRQAIPSLNPLLRAWADQEQGRQWLAAGLPAAFSEQGLRATARRPWVPLNEELIDAGLIGISGRPLDVPMPTPAAASVADHAQALAAHPVWQAVEARHPGTVQSAAERLAAARQQGLEDDRVQVEGQRVLQAQIPKLLAEAGPALREQYVRLMAEQLVALDRADRADCRATLTADPAALRTMPLVLVQRQAAWITAAAVEPAPAASAQRLSALELEVVQRNLGQRAAALLSGLAHPVQTRGSGLACTTAAALLNELLALPPAERRLALRLVGAR